LTPSSSRDDEDAQEASRLKVLVHDTYQRLARFAQNALSRPTAEEIREFNIEHGYDRLKHDKVDDFPQGLPRLAACMNSDGVFTNYRRFGRLSNRMLIHRMMDLTELEKKIDDLDIADAANPTMQFRLRGKEGYSGWDDTQRKLIDEACVKYSEYADILLKQAQLLALGKTSERNHKQLLNWIINNKPLGSGKYEFIFQADDFVSPGKAPEKDRWFEDLIESWLDSKGRFRSMIKNFLRTESERMKTDDEYFFHYDSARLTTLGNTLIVLLTVGGIAIPVLLLFLQSMNRAIMATVALVFVLFFPVSVSVVTGARVQDLMFGTAAYSAVVIMFLGNFSQGSGGKCVC